MTTLQDAKLATLQTQLAATGHVNDLELLWVQALGATSGSIVDGWWEVFDAAAIPPGQFNDRAVQYIISVVGAPPSEDYNEYWRHYWLNATLGPVAPSPPDPVNLLHWWDFTDAATVFSDVGGTTQALDGQSIRNVTNKGTDGQAMIDAGAVPVLRTDQINGLQVLDSAAIGSPLSTVLTNPSNAGGITIAVAVKIGASVATQAVVEWIEAAVTQHTIRANDSGFGWEVATSGDPGNFVNAGKAVIENQWVWVIGSITGAFYDHQVAGASIVAGLTGYNPVAGGATMNIGGIEGQVGEVLVYSNQQPQPFALTTYFDAKYGAMPLQRGLPAETHLRHFWDFNDGSTLWADTAGTIAITPGTPIKRADDKGYVGADAQDLIGGSAPSWVLDAATGLMGADSAIVNAGIAQTAWTVTPGDAAGIMNWAITRQDVSPGAVTNLSFSWANFGGANAHYGNRARQDFTPPDPYEAILGTQVVNQGRITGAGEHVLQYSGNDSGNNGRTKVSGAAEVSVVEPYVPVPVPNTITLAAVFGSTLQAGCYDQLPSVEERAMLVQYADWVTGLTLPA